MISYLNDLNYKIKLNTDEPVILFFTANWCCPAQAMDNIIENISIIYPGISIFKVDIDKNPEIKKRFYINAIPTLILYKNNKIKKCLIGYHNKDLTINLLLR